MDMKVKELIELLKQQDPEKDVYIQQGEEYPYTTVYNVREIELFDEDALDEEGEDVVVPAVVIEYQ